MAASERITNYIDELGDWRGKTLGQLRKLIKSTIEIENPESPALMALGGRYAGMFQLQAANYR